MTSYNLNEAKDVINEIIDITNENLKNGIKESLVVSLVGEAGIGKTDLPRQICEERDMGFHQLDIPQIDELVALSGYPRKVYTLGKKNDKGEMETIEVDHDLIPMYTNLGYVASKKIPPKLGFAAPHFLTKLDNPNGSILYLNDYSRAVPHVFQAVMELLQNKKYSTWKLPDNCIIVCSENPDNGDYIVATQDAAMKDRTAKVNVRFDAEVWADWAEKAGIPGVCINFILKSPEMVTGDDVVKGVSPRKWTKLFRTLTGITNWRSEQAVEKMQRNGSLFVGDLASHLSTFVANGLDKIISPAEIMDMEKSDKDVLESLKQSIHLDGNFRGDISAILNIRLKNYLKNMSTHTKIKKEHLDRLEKIFTSDENLFHPDSVFNTLLSMTSDSTFMKLVTRPTIARLLSR